MIMLRPISNSENDCNLGIKIFLAQPGEVRFSIEDQPVRATQEGFLNQKKGFYPTIVVSPGMAEFGPALVRVLPFQSHRYTTRRRSARHVENVR